MKVRSIGDLELVQVPRPTRLLGTELVAWLPFSVKRYFGVTGGWYSAASASPGGQRGAANVLIGSEMDITFGNSDLRWLHWRSVTLTLPTGPGSRVAKEGVPRSTVISHIPYTLQVIEFDKYIYLLLGYRDVL